MTETESSNSYERDLLNLLDKSWLTANEYVKFAGDISALFSSTIRLIHHSVAKCEEKGEDPTEAAFKSAEFLLKVSPTIKSALLRAATDMYGENIEQDEAKHIRKLSPNELVAVLALLFLYRRVQKAVSPEEWAMVEEAIALHIEIGGLVGSTFTFVGRGNGMLATGTRFLALMLFSMHDLPTFQKFRRAKKSSGKLFDLQGELETFGCTHLQVGSELLRRIGFLYPHSFASLGLGLDGVMVTLDAVPEEVLDNYLSWHIVLEFTEKLHQNGKLEPEHDENSPMYMSPEDLATLNDKCRDILDRNRGYNWFKMTDDSV